VSDFGLAKLVEGEDLSQSNDMAGTLRFMAPERLRGVTDRRGDIYALGATLYEMLSLRPVFSERDQVRLIDQIAHQAPIPLRQHDRRIPRDLETIVHKVLAKDPNDRCDKASELRDELRRFLDGRPTRWRRVGPVEQFRRWSKRNPALAATGAAIALLLIVSTILAFYSARKSSELAEQRGEQVRRTMEVAQLLKNERDMAVKSQRRAEAAEDEAQTQLFGALKERARAGRFSRQMGQRFQSLDALEKAAKIGRELRLPTKEFESLRDEAIACLALPDLEQVGRVIPRPPKLSGGLFALDPIRPRYALRFRDGTASVRDAAADHALSRFQAGGDGEAGILFFSPDGHYLATGQRPGGGLMVWDLDRRAVALDHPETISSGHSVRFSPDSRRIVLAHDDGDLIVYDLSTGRIAHRWRGPRPVHDLAIRGDGDRIAILYDEKGSTCRIIEAETGGLVRSYRSARGCGTEYA
jgi:hypothetical protein